MTSLTRPVFVTGIFLIFSSTAYSAPVNCSSEALAARLSHCNSFDSALSGPAQFTKLCNSTDCSIQCLIDAYASCPSVGVGRLADTRTQKVAIRYACAHFNELVQAVNACEHFVMSSSCLTTLFDALQNVTLALVSINPDYDAYIRGYCSAAKTYHSCVPDMPTSANKTCTANQALLLYGIFNVTYSLSPCGIKQDHHAFTLYDGPVLCSSPPVIG